MNDVATKHWNHFNEEGRQRMSRMAAAAAWGLSQWDAMEQYVNCIPRDTQDGAFYRAVLAVHRGQYIAAQQVIVWYVGVSVEWCALVEYTCFQFMFFLIK